jgi:hypothetical protein
VAPSEVPDVRRPPLLGPRAAVGVLAGGVTGGFAAWAYYDDTFRPLSHSFGLWIALLALLSAGQPARRAITHSGLALAAAVLAFYVGKKVMYGIDYPGMPYSINTSELTEWLILSAVVGVVLGWAFSWAGRPGPAGALGTAAVVGLLLGDAYRRVHGYGSAAPVLVAFTVLAVVAVLALTVRTWSRLAQVAAFAVPCAVLGFLLVSAPDLLEQFLFTGGF